MLFDAQAFTLREQDSIAILTLDLKDQSVNKLTRQTIIDLEEVFDLIKNNDALKGLVVCSAKSDFIVGADITEFLSQFNEPHESIVSDLMNTHKIFNKLEDLPMPTLMAINGLALGGGCELALCADYRMMAEDAQIGLPEVKLGIFPGFAGTVRLPRVIGLDNAIEWICGGKQNKAGEALKVGLAQAVVAEENLLDAAIKQMQLMIEQKFDFKKHREEKLQPLLLNNIESMMAFETSIGFVAAKAGRHYPAPVAAIKCMQKHAQLSRGDAQLIEADGFAKIAKTDVAKNLIGLFMADQKVKKVSKKYSKDIKEIDHMAVLGAGIMGGGIAYQAASKNLTVLMKDVREEGIALGLDEANKLCSKQVERKKYTVLEAGACLNRIRPTMSYGDFNQTELVVEAVVENPKIKKMVLAETEENISDQTVLASNTSTISIDDLASDLKRPELFCGMHFFNPVHRMPLVEIIRGKKTSEKTIGSVVSLAKKMGKTPIVVNDCPGFFVNRVLFPYFGGFTELVKAQVDFHLVDKIMEKFGWPMGPAYLLDVVGLDTAFHAQQVMAQGFPERMSADDQNAVAKLHGEDRFGEKNKLGFYQYIKNKKGKFDKKADDKVTELLYPDGYKELAEQDVILRLMAPMLFEVARCLEEGIVASAQEADMALIYGIGFPPHLGGALKYLDNYGLAKFLDDCSAFESISPLYVIPEFLKEKAKNNELFYRGEEA